MRPAHRPTSALAALLCLCGCLPTWQGEQPLLTGQNVRLTVLHTSDIHSRLLPYDLAPLKTDADLGLAPEAPPYGGVARLAALIKRERAAADRALLVDSGDYWEGGPVFNALAGEPEVRYMSSMNYDAIVMGNHEFDRGVQNFADKIARFASYPLLAANYHWENTSLPNAHGLDKLSSPYTIATVRGVKVGILGMGSISSMYSLTDGGNSMLATPLETNECARAYVDLLMPQVDLVMVLSHLGLSEDQSLVTGYDAYYPYENAKRFFSVNDNSFGQRHDGDLVTPPWQQIDPDLGMCASLGTPRDMCTYLDGTVQVFIPGVSGIDVIEGGHLHIVLNPPQVLTDPMGRPVILSHSGAFSKYLGRLELQLQFPTDDDTDERKAQGAEIVAHDYRVFPVDAIWCDEEARSWRATVQYDQFKALITARPTTAADGSSCRVDFWNALPSTVCATTSALCTTNADCDTSANEPCVDFANTCIAKYDQDLRGYDCDRYLPVDCMSRTERCSTREDRPTTELLQPYIEYLDDTYALTRIFAYAPKDIERRNSSTGGDSPLGNMTAESMRTRKRVEAEFSLTNTLGIRDNLYTGPITMESMFNVFPFENTINIMYLSGAEVQELTDYVATRSADRGCQSQAQVSGMTFVMDCAQYQLNLNRYPCGLDIPLPWSPDDQKRADQECKDTLNPLGMTPQHPDGWQCTSDRVCWAHESFGIDPATGNPSNPIINGQVVDYGATYKIAVNDYIAKGGSGFKVLKRNTTRIETGISLRDSLIDYLRNQCSCADILGLEGNPNNGLPEESRSSSSGSSCARSFDVSGHHIIDPLVKTWCGTADNFELWLKANPTWLPDNNPTMCHCSQILAGDYGSCDPLQQLQLDDLKRKQLHDYCSLSVGKCSCAQVIVGDERACGHITKDIKDFCSAPTTVAIAIAEEDGRIGRRVK